MGRYSCSHLASIAVGREREKQRVRGRRSREREGEGKKGDVKVGEGGGLRNNESQTPNCGVRVLKLWAVKIMSQCEALVLLRLKTNISKVACFQIATK